jgi:hypothetical protein
MWPEPSSPLLQASPSRVPSQRNRALPYSPDGGIKLLSPSSPTAEGLSHRKRIALFAVLTVLNLIDPPMLKLNVIRTNSTENFLKHILGDNKEIGKKGDQKTKGKAIYQKIRYERSEINPQGQKRIKERKTEYKNRINTRCIRF